jgi:uncharacterized protein (TIGR00251 family)
MAAHKNSSGNIRAPSRDSRAAPPAPTFCLLAIKAIPNAPRNEAVGWLGDALKVKVHAPPVEGRANEALCEFLADTLGLPRRAVTVLRGDTSRQKLVRIEGRSLAEVRAALRV